MFLSKGKGHKHVKSCSTSSVLKNSDKNKMFCVDKGVKKWSLTFPASGSIIVIFLANNLAIPYVLTDFKMCVPIDPAIPPLEM